MNRQAIVQVLEAVTLGVAMVLSATLAASGQISQETRRGPSAAPESEAPVYVETESAKLSEATEPTARALRVAEALRKEAERLHALPERWEDAAALHIHSADMRGLRDDVALSELFIAGGLFYETGNRHDAVVTLEMAGDLSLDRGALADARFAYEHAAELAFEIGDREAAKRLALKAAHVPGDVGLPGGDAGLASSLDEWRELLAETVVPAPAVAVAIDRPEMAADSRLDEALDRVSLAAPPEPGLSEIGATGVILPVERPENGTAARGPDVEIEGPGYDPALDSPNDSEIETPVLKEPPLPALSELDASSES